MSLFVRAGGKDLRICVGNVISAVGIALVHKIIVVKIAVGEVGIVERKIVVLEIVRIKACAGKRLLFLFFCT